MIPRHLHLKSELHILRKLHCSDYYAPAQGALSDDAVWRLTYNVCLTSDVWRLSIAYIVRKSRTESPKTKIGTEVAHVTRDSDTTFKVKRSKVNFLLMS